MKRVRVPLGPRSYEIRIGRKILEHLEEDLNRLPALDRKIALITHPVLEKLYGRPLDRLLRNAGWRPKVLTLPAGERYKTLRTLSRIYDFLVKERFERTSPLLALGGGVIGDMVGFAASTYLRGVPYIQVPTTLLAQVDSSVGGKTGVDHPLGKNLIGAFYQPRLVLIDVETLNTLPSRELRAGLAEVVKYGVIADPELFEYLERHAEDLLNLRPDRVIHVVTRSCRIKAAVVGRDEREGGLRAILNYGHTFGHAIETLTGYRAFRHGEAIAVGMVCAARLAHRLGMCPPDVAARTEVLLRRLGLPTRFPAIPFSPFYQTLQRDKKVVGETLRFVLPLRIGEVRILEVSDKKVLKEVLQIG
ncbi:MAG: 3-dehydroquinate synthase [Nitrospirae bacterium]|nr:3-dehydroquinate synthase [Nitrospirota bacterium]